MKKIFLISVIAALGISANAQQIPMYNQYYINPFIINPSLTGSGMDVNTFLIHRNQWTDFPGAPVTNAFTLDLPVKAQKIGLGLGVFRDETDIFSRTGVSAFYSYRVNLTENSHLLMGLSLGFIDHKVEFEKAVVTDVSDPYLFMQPQRKTAVDATAGFTFVRKNLEIGLAVPKLAAPKLEYLDNFSRSFYSDVRHYMMSGKYVFMVNEKSQITAYPLTLVRYAPGAPVQYDINGVLDWKNLGWAGIAYKSNYAVSANLGVRFSGFTVGYSYDIMTGSIRDYAGNSSEIIIGYSFGNKKENESLAPAETKPGDSDGDGVADDKDLEPFTPYGAFVDEFGRALDGDGDKVPDGLDLEPDTKPGTLVNFQGIAINQKPDLGPDADHDGIPDSLDQEQNTNENMLVNMHGVAIWIGNPPTQVERNVRFSSIFFDFNQSKLRSSENNKMIDAVSILNANPLSKIIITGFTDKSGSDEYNMVLGQKRAQSVADEFINNYGIDKNRIIQILSKGKKEPLSKNNDEVNRRVDISFR